MNRAKRKHLLSVVADETVRTPHAREVQAELQKTIRLSTLQGWERDFYATDFFGVVGARGRGLRR